ncbi:protein of unknown function [Nocardiopsis flavescens]|uniref:DUF4287 domain-containing protein n=1 Tax=Nocardiopsis flavescens TaxID=758803 RepID=A0A1M6APV8_9ACTN|nr:DUF4287 domain-containing protein [Nocardiopsis flavescens]SHI38495.1 protein of unknown function [Nocardiopsis flavescens]
MTRNKSFKQRVRSRMAKTGERYTAARAHLVPEGERPGAGPAAAADAHGASPAAPTAPMRARVSSDAVRERTGHGYDTWFARLDAWGATARSHREIAAHLVQEHGVGGWWAQSLTVAYEQERGMRVPGRRADGYTASASKTVRAPLEDVFAALVHDQVRERWLQGTDLAVLSHTPPRRVTADPGDGTRVVLYLTDRGGDRVSVAVEQSRLADAASAARAKESWREHLGRLKSLVEPAP